MSSEAELEDELAVQRTILSSLDGHSFDGVEAERAEIRATILELQRRLRQTQGNAHAHGRQAQQNGGKLQIILPGHLSFSFGVSETPKRTQRCARVVAVHLKPRGGVPT